MSRDIFRYSAHYSIIFASSSNLSNTSRRLITIFGNIVGINSGLVRAILLLELVDILVATSF